MFIRFIFGISHDCCNLGRVGLAASSFSMCEPCCWYSLAFCENLTLFLGLPRAHPVCRGELVVVSPGEVCGHLESEEQFLLSEVSTDENLSAQSLLTASYWLSLLTVCLPTSRWSSGCANASKASAHPSTEHSNSGVGLSIFFLASEGCLPWRFSGGS